MSKFTRTMAFSAAMLLLTGSAARADDSYGEAVGQKLGAGFSNLGLGVLEIPKNIISTTNQTNLLFGVTGGMVKGTAHALGRMMSGLVDVLSSPVPTKPIPNPPFVWQNWYIDTTYGPFFPAKKAEANPGRAAGSSKRY